MNAQQKSRNDFGIVMGTQQINQSTQEQDLRNAHMSISASVQHDINSGVDQIEQANVDLAVDENKDKREARIRAIRSNTQSMIRGETTALLKYSGGVESVSAFVVGGDRNNRSFQDYQHAIELGQGADAALSAAAKGSDLSVNPNEPTSQQVSDIQSKMDNLISAMQSLQ